MCRFEMIHHLKWSIYWQEVCWYWCKNISGTWKDMNKIVYTMELHWREMLKMDGNKSVTIMTYKCFTLHVIQPYIYNTQKISITDDKTSKLTKFSTCYSLSQHNCFYSAVKGTTEMKEWTCHRRPQCERKKLKGYQGLKFLSTTSKYIVTEDHVFLGCDNEMS